MTVLAGQLGPLGVSRGAPAAPWTPDLLGSLSAWWDAGTITGKVEGDAITSWPSDYGPTAIAYNSPKYRESVIGGLPGIEFTGTSYAATAASLTSQTIAVVIKHIDTPTFAGFRRVIDADDLAHGWSIFGEPGYKYNPAGTYPRNITVANFYQTGVQGAIAASPVSTPKILTAIATAAANQRVSLATYSATGSQEMNGSICEAVLFDSALSDADRQRAEGYLAWKYGLEGNLPSDHPYKSSAPEAP